MEETKIKGPADKATTQSKKKLRTSLIKQLHENNRDLLPRFHIEKGISQNEAHLTGCFYASRLLDQLGMKYDPKIITKVLEVVGITPNKKKIQEFIQERCQISLNQSHQANQTPGGIELLIEGENGKLNLKSEENVEKNGGSNVKNLIEILRVSTEVKNIDGGYVNGMGGEESIKVKVDIGEVKKFNGYENQLVQEILFYRTLQREFSTRIRELEQQQKLNPRYLDDIEFYTHLGLEKNKRAKKLIKVADFVRELYGLIEINTEITQDQIYSNLTGKGIAKQRHVTMYILKNKFPFLSTPEIGKIMGPLGNPKNHATVLGAIKRFNPKIGMNLIGYQRIRRAKKLYEDAQFKYDNFKK